MKPADQRGGPLATGDTVAAHATASGVLGFEVEYVSK